MAFYCRKLLAQLYHVAALCWENVVQASVFWTRTNNVIALAYKTSCFLGACFLRKERKGNEINVA